MALSSNAITKIVVVGALAAMVGGMTIWYFHTTSSVGDHGKLERGAKDAFAKLGVTAPLTGPEIALANPVAGPLYVATTIGDRVDLSSYSARITKLLDEDRRATRIDEIGTYVLVMEDLVEYTITVLPRAATLVLVDVKTHAIVGRKTFTADFAFPGAVTWKSGEALEDRFWRPVGNYLNTIGIAR